MRSDYNIRKFKRNMILKRILKKVFFLILIITIIIILLYSSGAIKANKLSSVFNNSYDNNISEEIFNINIDNDVIDIHNFNENIFAITKKNGIFYDDSGDIIDSFEHNFKDPIVLLSNNYLVTYDMHGKQIIVHSSAKKYSTLKLDNNIITLSVAPNGNIAVVTLSDDYECVVTLYNKNLEKELYKYYSEHFITGIAFSTDSNFIYGLYVDVEGGLLNTNIISLNTKSEDTKDVLSIKDDMGIHIDVIDDRILVVCKNKTYFINIKTNEETNIAHEGDIMFFDINHNNKNIMLVSKTFKNEYDVSLFSKTGQLINKDTIGNDILDISNHSEKIVVLTKDVLYNYNNKLDILDTSTINQYTSKAISCRNNTFILGRNTIYKNNIINEVNN